MIIDVVVIFKKGVYGATKLRFLLLINLLTN
jgi:hypothetical protein